MPKVSVDTDGVYQSTVISNETYDILEDSSLIFNLRKEWFLFEAIKAYGVLSEMNLLRLIRSVAEKQGFGEE